MIRINDLLDDYYYYDEDKYELIGNETGRVFKLGQVVQVEVARTDKNLRQIDFKLYEEESEENN